MKCDKLIRWQDKDLTEYYEAESVDTAIAELKAKLKESEEARYEADADAADYYQENRRLKRALWLARAEMARTSAWVFWNRKDDYNYNKWKKVERKCRAKAEGYK